MSHDNHVEAPKSVVNCSNQITTRLHQPHQLNFKKNDKYETMMTNYHFVITIN